MYENKKGLRIAAGILLPVYAVCSFVMMILVYFYLDFDSFSAFLSVYWFSLLSLLALGVTGVMILLRAYQGAGLVQGLVALSVLVLAALNIYHHITEKLDTGSMVFTYLVNLADLSTALLLLLGFFRKSPASKLPFLLAAILSCLSKALPLVRILINDLSFPLSPSALGTLLLFVAVILAVALPPLLAWLFMAFCFAAQRETGPKLPPFYPQPGLYPQQGPYPYDPQWAYPPRPPQEQASSSGPNQG